MEPSARQVEILRAAAAFATVARYHGTLPRRQALHYAKDDLAGLEDAGFLERVKLSFPCGKAVAGWRLTDAGRRALPGREPAGDLELEDEHLRILNDVYHSSRLSAHRGMMPKALARQFDGDDMDDLFSHGYLLRIRIKSGRKAKGWIVSSKGLSALRRAAAEPDSCVASPDGP